MTEPFRIPLVAAEAAGLLRGDDTSLVTLAEIEGARARVWISMFIVALAPDDDPRLRVRELGDALVRAARRGVDARVIVDSFTAADGFPTNLVAARWLRDRGVATRVYRHEQRPSNHSKSAIVDAHTVIVGSGNWSAGGLYGNLEVAVRVRSVELNALLAARFESDWDAALESEEP